MSSRTDQGPSEAALSRMSRLFRRASKSSGDGEGASEESQMRASRRMSFRKQGTGTSGPSLGFATARPRDPLFYWKQNNLPYEFDDSAQMKRMRAYCRLVYAAHPIVGSCVDIYAQYPLLGMQLECFSGETRVLTSAGTFRIEELAGQTHTVLTTGGKWVDAPFKAYGERPLLKLTLRRNGRTKVIFSTANHRWFAWDTSGPGRGSSGESNPSARLTWEQVQEMRRRYAAGEANQTALAKEYGVSQPMIGNIVRRESWKTSGAASQVVDRLHPVKHEVVTADLLPGTRLVSCYPTNRVHATNPSPFGIAHGMVYGDGTRNTCGRGASVDLHGKKDAQMLRYFTGCTTYDLSPTAIRVTDLPAFFKELPSVDEGQSYLYGWLAGYFAADGTVSKKSEMFLDSVSLESIEFARTVCTRLGIKTYQPYEINVPQKMLPNGSVIKDWRGYRLPIDSGSVTSDFFCIEHHRERWEAKGVPTRKRPEDWDVVSVEPTNRVETVYCAEIPGTQAFTLEDNILTGNCKDDRLTDFYQDLFFNEENGLNYDEFLVDMGREYWLVGESWPLATFNEALGVWDDEELLDPDNVEVQRSPFLRDPRFLIRLPEAMRELIRTRQPAWEYAKLMAQYPELAAYADDNMLMPVSNILLRQLKFKGGGPNAKRGVPLLYRAMRSLMQEEMLNAAVDAVADRLYTPLILAKLGASATDLGTQVPWIPTQDDLADFEEALDSALAGDFRVLTHHFGIDMAPVLGKEDMPDFTDDFERIEGRILQTFGLSKTMLAGASSGETYAADALNRDLVTQLLTRYQKQNARHYRQRALVVAEAQEHFDYEVRGGRRYVKMEEILETDEETGEQRIVEQPKLLIPDLQFKTMSLQDESAQSEFFEALREAGVPVSIKTRLHNVPITFDEEVERSMEEQVEMAVAEQQTRRELYTRLRDEGLPIAPDLRADFEPRALPEGQDPAMDMLRQPMLGMDPVSGQSTLAPTAGDVGALMPAGGVSVPGVPTQAVDPGQGQDGGAGAGDQSQVPPESSEQRGGMPKAAALFRGAQRMRRLGEAHDRRPVYGEDSEVVVKYRLPHGRYADPVHVGARRYLVLDPDMPMDEE